MDSRSLGDHTVHRFDQELETLRARVLQAGGLVEKQLDEALTAVFDRDGAAAERVVESDRQVNELELEIDGLCGTLLARRTPVASDLRFVLAVIKAITDLERMGDEAVRIARMAIRLSNRDGRHGGAHGLRHLGDRVRSMLGDALDAFARTDPEAAVGVLEEDRGVDREYESLMRELITYMMEDARAIPNSLDVLFSARALERIGDRSCNLCEYVIYIVKGTDVRHAGLAHAQQSALDDAGGGTAAPG